MGIFDILENVLDHAQQDYDIRLKNMERKQRAAQRQAANNPAPARRKTQKVVPSINDRMKNK